MSVKNFWQGFWAPIRAVGLISRSPKALSLVILPLGLNICLYIVFFHYGSDYMTALVSRWTSMLSLNLPHWLLGFANITLKVLGWLILGLIAALSFTLVSGLISAPFNDALSRAALKSYGGTVPIGPKLEFRAIIGLELKRMAILALGAVVALVLGLVPLMQLPALALGALLVSFEYFGYPISHRSSSLFPVIYFTLRHPLTSLGFGSFLLLMMVLPFTSIFYIPLAVVGGTMLYADCTKASLK